MALGVGLVVGGMVLPIVLCAGLVLGGVLRLPGFPSHPAFLTSANLGFAFKGAPGVFAPAPTSSGAFSMVNLMLRQADCSLTEDFVANLNLLTQSFTVQSAPDVQDYLHAAAGLTTPPDVFPDGCPDSDRGVGDRYAVFLGKTGDGKQLVATFLLFRDLVIFTGDLNGPWSETLVSLPDSSAAGDLNVGDVNGDGHADLIVPVIGERDTSGDGVVVVLNHGDGSFSAPTFTPVPLLRGVTLDDFDGDGKLDLAGVTAATMPGGGGAVVLLPGKGDGTFKTAIPGPSINSPYESFLASADFNGDGNRDLVLGDGEVLLGNGDGSFALDPHSIPVSGLNPTGNFPAVADFNDDGKDDVALLATDGSVAIFLGNGDGSFSAASQYQYAGIAQAFTLTATDLDGDGNADLVEGSANGGGFGADENTDGAFLMLMGRGDGSFVDSTVYPLSVSPTFAVGDFNGDGKPDVLATQGSGPNVSGMMLLAGNGDGTFAPQPPDTAVQPLHVAAADMNGDGNLDAVVIDQTQTHLGVLLANGNGGFGAPTSYPIPAGGQSGTTLTVGDFRGNGPPDVIVGNGGDLLYYRNNGDGTLAAAQQFDQEDLVDATAVGDMNGDGNADLAVAIGNFEDAAAGANNVVLVFLSNGDGTFAAPVRYAAGAYPRSIALGDLNQDGKPDLVVGSINAGLSANTLNVLLGNGDGTFGAALRSPLPYDAGSSSLAIADFDGDGNPDVAIGGGTYTFVSLGKGDGTFSGNYASPLGSLAENLAVADLNHDQRPDLLLTSGSLGFAKLAALVNVKASATPPGPGGTPTATTATLRASTTHLHTGQRVTFTATVAAAEGSVIPAGTVHFNDGDTTLGSAPLSDSGTASFATSSLAAGSHSITAAYAGDSNFGASTSPPVTVTVIASTPPPTPPPGTPPSSGGGAMNPLTVILLFALGAWVALKRRALHLRRPRDP
ncbi:MAG TPA: FG-GAP-like repeat-containing protein [Gammaproteobacteria bacterium]|nr:FG-GAP-like repeat-containing protein [Gammaproteobacteria bacterium]